MRYVFSILIVILFFQNSCTKSKEALESNQLKDSITMASSNLIVSGFSETLIPSAKAATDSCRAYTDLDSFILKYYAIEPSNALLNSGELLGFVKHLKDSLTVPKLQKPEVLARVNVLYSEVLRLNDMSTISVIKEEEIEKQVLSIIEVFTALKAKINTVYKADEVQNSLEFDVIEPLEDSLPQLNPSGNKPYVKPFKRPI